MKIIAAAALAGAALLATAVPALADEGPTTGRGILQDVGTVTGDDPLTGDPIKSSTSSLTNLNGQTGAVPRLVDFLASKNT
ncbi:hypothetical protein [Streptomyces sp. NRRL F-2747]|uniref:hypothetical protein n=1 Tax=Streptomyces sp. NRRL F-2747 TaxID=1463843 RepID=UPI0004CABE1B|nr:hypothetical protein [Streptomyces sp. NRRL F-2747]